MLIGVDLLLSSPLYFFFLVSPMKDTLTKQKKLLRNIYYYTINALNHKQKAVLV